MIQKEEWLSRLMKELLAAWLDRLLFVGLQGSYRRGEATEASDFDLVVVLDRLAVEDLKRYREVLATMPEHEKACGFICGREELARWPRHEIFQLVRETEAYYGSLEELAPPVNESDIRRSIRIEAANLYHAACHTCLYGDPDMQEEMLRKAHKSAFFALQLVHCTRTGDYVDTRQALAELLEGEERELLTAFLRWEEERPLREADNAPWFQRLIHWSGGLLAEYPEDGE